MPDTKSRLAVCKASILPALQAFVFVLIWGVLGHIGWQYSEIFLALLRNDSWW